MMPDPDVNNLKTDIEVLKRDVVTMNHLLGRVDTAIDKIAEASNGISKILAVHDQSIDSLKTIVEERKRIADKEFELLQSKIVDVKDTSQKERKEHQSEILAALESLEKRMTEQKNELSDRLAALEKWKWWIMGAAAVIGFFISKLTGITLNF